MESNGSNYFIKKEHQKMLNLWQQVIIEDVNQLRENIESNKLIDSEYIDWVFSSKDNDFNVVCAYAEIDPQFVKSQYKKILDAHKSKVKFIDQSKVFKPKKNKDNNIESFGNLRNISIDAMDDLSLCFDYETPKKKRKPGGGRKPKASSIPKKYSRNKK